jgi:hypothetical protein
MEVVLKFFVGEKVVERSTQHLVEIIGLDFKHGIAEPYSPSPFYHYCVNYHVQYGDYQYWCGENELTSPKEKYAILELNNDLPGIRAA